MDNGWNGIFRMCFEKAACDAQVLCTDGWLLWSVKCMGGVGDDVCGYDGECVYVGFGGWGECGNRERR